MKSKLLCFSTLLLLTACNNSSDSPPAADTPGGTFDISAETAPVVAAATDPDRDMPLEDKTFYGVDGGGSVELGQVSEVTSLMHHSMKIGGKDVKFTARAGHLIAYKPAAGGGDPQAAIFYTSYTRDDLPRENRPVTFLWNGGPGASSRYLQLGSWSPKRIIVNPGPLSGKDPANYYSIADDPETLLDRSDLVFVDPVGTGFSSAIAPHKNEDFWGIDSDPKVLRDFITRYINTYNRQSSPKYLYGESYGGIRTPITARLLLEAGSAHYLPDPSGKPPVALSGIVLQSPVLDYNSNCGMELNVSCEGLLPTYAATADYYGLLPARGKRSLEDFLVDVRAFGATSYRRVQHDIIGKIADPSEKTPQEEFLERLQKRDVRDDFIHRSDTRKEELVKALDALGPTPLKAFVMSFVNALSPFIFTKYCIQWEQAGAQALRIPDLPVAIDVDLRPYKRITLSAKEFVSVPEDMKNLIVDIFKKKEFNLTETLVKSGVFLDYYTGLASAIVKLESVQTFEKLCNPVKPLSNYVSSPAGETYLKSLHAYTGLRLPTKILDSDWLRYPNMKFPTFLDKLLPGYSFNIYDARQSMPGMNDDPSFASEGGENAAVADLLPGFVGYINRTAPYMGLNRDILVSWNWTPDPDVKFSTSRLRTSIPDLIESLTLKSDLKVLVLHGYTDLVTPFHQTELDLENAKLADRIPLKTFEGGHMTYGNEASRAPMKAVLDQFYAGTLGGPGTGFASNPPVASPVPIEVGAPSDEMAPIVALLHDLEEAKGVEEEIVRLADDFTSAGGKLPDKLNTLAETARLNLSNWDSIYGLLADRPELLIADPVQVKKLQAVANPAAISKERDLRDLMRKLTTGNESEKQSVLKEFLQQALKAAAGTVLAENTQPVGTVSPPVRSEIPQQDIDKLVAEIKEVLKEYSGGGGDKKTQSAADLLKQYINDPAQYKNRIHFNLARRSLETVKTYLADKKKAPATPPSVTGPSAPPTPKPPVVPVSNPGTLH